MPSPLPLEAARVGAWEWEWGWAPWTPQTSRQISRASRLLPLPRAPLGVPGKEDTHAFDFVSVSPALRDASSCPLLRALSWHTAYVYCAFVFWILGRGVSCFPLLLFCRFTVWQGHIEAARSGKKGAIA